MREMREENCKTNQAVSKKGKIEERYDYEIILLNGSREKGKVLKRENGEWEVRRNKKKNKKKKSDTV